MEEKTHTYFWDVGLAVRLLGIEIKSGATLTSDWVDGTQKWLALAGDDAINPTLVYGGETAWAEGPTKVIPWPMITELADSI